jgi:hypothetical protein
VNDLCIANLTIGKGDNDSETEQAPYIFHLKIFKIMSIDK